MSYQGWTDVETIKQRNSQVGGGGGEGEQLPGLAAGIMPIIRE